ncbi:nuclear transport factor 2 family protein [Streptomyces sp. NPDC004658]|uniref:nuclear transport factor 2 family protein n=1 Tax=Streptomyces sp. NPDC004658 TaxID=3154672 RepID=UPI0033B17683
MSSIRDAHGHSKTRADSADAWAVIDLVNRLNRAVDEWDMDVLVGSFTEDGVLHHPRGTVQGHEQLKRFYDDHRPLTAGVRRACLNHVVDRNDDGTLTVTSNCLAFRVAEPDAATAVGPEPVTVNRNGLPVIYLYSIWRDLCRKDPLKGWRIQEKWVASIIVNAEASPH